MIHPGFFHSKGKCLCPTCIFTRSKKIANSTNKYFRANRKGVK